MSNNHYFVEINLNGGDDSCMFVADGAIVERDQQGNLTINGDHGTNLFISAKNITGEEHEDGLDTYQIRSNSEIIVTKNID